MNLKIYTLGCKVNQYDSRTLAGKLEAVGFCLAEYNADLVIINTCAVTKTAIQKGKRMINRARKENPEAKIAVMGCWPKVYSVDSLDGAEVVENERELYEVIKKIFNFQFLISNKIPNSKFQIPKKIDRSRYFIKVQDGCEQFCSYCVIPYARGKLKSREPGEILKEISEAVKNGFNEIVLCGIHLGLYGKDLESNKLEVRSEKPEIKRRKGKANLVNLLSKIIKITDLGRVRLSSIEITEVSNELISLMAANRKLCLHLHIPLQSGSDKILRLMNRPYDRKFFRGRVEKIRKAAPDVALTTDVIAGFPGETGADFVDTYNFIKEMKFSRLHVFPFSAHEKTPAAKMPGAVGDEIKRERAKKLKALGEKLSREYERKFIGRELNVVVGGKKAGDKFIGKSEYFFDVLFDESQIAGEKTAKSGRGGKAGCDNGLFGRFVKVKFL